MGLSEKNWRTYFLIAIGVVIAGSFGFSKTASATGIGQPLGGRVSILGPAWQISLDQEECELDEWTVAEETQTSSWNAETDQGDDQTFNLEQDFSPEPHPEAYILERSVKSDTPEDLDYDRWILGKYTEDFKEVGTCEYTDTTTYPPVSVSWDWPYFMWLGNVTEYGASETAAL